MRFRDRGSTRKVGMCELLLLANKNTALEILANQRRALEVGGRRNVVGVVTQGLPLFSGTDFPKTGVRF